MVGRSKGRDNRLLLPKLSGDLTSEWLFREILLTKVFPCKLPQSEIRYKLLRKLRKTTRNASFSGPWGRGPSHLDFVSSIWKFPPNERGVTKRKRSYESDCANERLTSYSSKSVVETTERQWRCRTVLGWYENYKIIWLAVL